ncbi:MAG: DNA mismatch endonuclease Vsr [Nocardioides sp.]|uniref:very short patch repair endonuclease n=1 Tax=Nocardioides sp. TaxID=35761 RepID=UPI00238FA952|nr:DNA mismatch endonuclease Vsr [Nocardioides sp.]MDE0778434.1 DNA mismatch endonuclease Vsr [Nocardioides sp.]
MTAEREGDRTTSWASSPAVRSVMRANRRRDTRPELEVRRLVHAMGLRYLVDAAPIRASRRRADLVFRGPRVAVFIDGCFWHACPEHGMTPRTNTVFWSEKLRRNSERDAETDRLLVEADWLPLRFWEHQDRAEVAAAVADVVRRRRPMRDR